MRQALCLVYTPFRLLLILVLSPILTVIYWLLLLMTIPIHLFRKLLSFIARRTDPGVTKIVNTMGHLISRDYEDWCSSPSQVITVIFKIKGSLPVAKFRQLFLKKWVHKTYDDNRGMLEYPELQQYFAKRLGYLFFKWDPTFNIANHVNMYSHKELLPNPETDVVNESTMMRIWEEMVTRPFEEKRSPWDVHLIPNYEPPGKCAGSSEEDGDHDSLAFVRMHHGLCDGSAVYKLLLLLTDNGLEDLESQIGAFKKAPRFLDFFLNLNAFICGPASVIRRLSKGLDLYNPLHLSLGKNRRRGNLVKMTADVEQIKKISRVHLDVSFHAVLIAALAGGIRNYLIGNGYRIPLSPIRVGLPIPKPGHTHKLRNEYLVSVVDLPIDKKTPRERVLTVEKRLNSLRTEAFMPFLSQAWKALGLLPSKVVRVLTTKSAVSVMYSEIKGPGQLLTFLDGKCQLMDLMYTFGLGTDDCGVAFNSISYNGKVHLMLGLDYGIAQTRDKAQRLLNLIEKELEQLQYGDSTNL